MSIRLIGLSVMGAAIVFAGAQTAAAQSGQDPLTLHEAVARAVAGNPALRGSEYLLQATQARELRAAQGPAMSLGAELEDFAGTGEASGTQALQTTLRLSGVLELGGKRAARVELARSETDVAQIDQRAQRVDLLARVASRFVTVAAHQEHLVLAREGTRLAQTTVERVRERIRIGAAPRYELARAEIRLERARIEHEHVEHQLASSRVQLAALWGATTPDFTTVAASLFEFPQPGSLEQLTARIEASPAIQRMLSRERLAEAQLELARRSREADISWSGGVRHMQAFDDAALVASISVPFGARRRAEPAIREAVALRAKAPLEAQMARTEAQALLFDLYQEYLHTRLEVQSLRETVMPLTLSVLASTEEAFRQGRSSFLEYAGAQQQLLEVRRDAIDAAAEHHALLIEIERLTGTAVAQQSVPGER